MFTKFKYIGLIINISRDGQMLFPFYCVRTETKQQNYTAMLTHNYKFHVHNCGELEKIHENTLVPVDTLRN